MTSLAFSADQCGRSGPAPRRAARPGASGDDPATTALSARELEVVWLVADGMSNRQIAARLYLSEKVVETHLARAFTRLGVSNRAALAGRIAARR